MFRTPVPEDEVPVLQQKTSNGGSAVSRWGVVQQRWNVRRSEKMVEDSLLAIGAAARRLSARVCGKLKDVVYLYSCFSGCGSGGERGEFPKRSKGADCKSAAVVLRRFESYTRHASMAQW